MENVREATTNSDKFKNYDLHSVDSRWLAERFNVQHDSVMENISNYFTEFQMLGNVKIRISDGIQEKYAFLNEDHAIFALTLSPNTPEVVQLKFDLTVGFDGDF